MTAHSIPKATLGRIPLYIRYLRELPDDYKTISAPQIARGLSLGEVQVRKDLALISGRGKPRVGYDRSKLMKDIESHLGFDSLTNAVLVGAGKLGKALLEYDGFEDFGIKIIAGFDCNEKASVIKSSKPILPMKDIDSFCTENDVKIGIITVGQSSAQEVCDKLVSCGVSAIWNFTPSALVIPDNVFFKQENLALSLAYLNSQLKKNNRFED